MKNLVLMFVFILLIILNSGVNFCKYNEEELKRALNKKEIATIERILREVGEFVEVVHDEKGVLVPLVHYIVGCFGLSEKEKVTIIRLLRDMGFNIDRRDFEGKTVLHKACEFGYYELVLELVKLGVNLFYEDNYGRFFFHYLSGRPPEISQEDFPLDYYISYDVARHSIRLLEEIRKYGLDICKKDILGNTIFHYAVRANNNFLVDYILKEGKFDINDQNYNGETVLHIAVSELNEKIIDKLLAFGCSVEIRDREGRPACFYILLKDIGLTYGSVMLKDNILEVQKRIIVKMMRNGFDINMVDFRGNNLLHYAVEEDNIGLIRCLIELKCSEDILNKDGFSARDLYKLDTGGHDFHWLAMKSDVYELARLIKEGVNVNKREEKGMRRTALHIAVETRDENVVCFLIEKGVDVNIADEFGETPIFYALWGGDLRIAEILIERGADVKKVNNKGKTPIQIMKEMNYLRLLELVNKKRLLN